jgi:hypothetical protein
MDGFSSWQVKQEHAILELHAVISFLVKLVFLIKK